MITVQVADYTQFKGVVKMLAKGRPHPSIMFVDYGIEGFTVVAIVENAAISMAHKLETKPETFDKDYPDAMPIVGIGVGG